MKETILQNALKDSGILWYECCLCFSAGESGVRVSSCPPIYLLISHSSIHIIPLSLFLLAALCVSISRGLHRPSLIILQFTIGRPHPYPLASAASTNRFYSPSRRGIHIYSLCVQFTFASRERHQLVLTSLHPSWFIIVLLPNIVGYHDFKHEWSDNSDVSSWIIKCIPA